MPTISFNYAQVSIPSLDTMQLSKMSTLGQLCSRHCGNVIKMRYYKQPKIPTCMGGDLGGKGEPPKFEVRTMNSSPQYFTEILYIIRNVHILSKVSLLLHFGQGKVRSTG